MPISGFKCGVCGVTFSDPDVCVIHFMQVHPNKPYSTVDDVDDAWEHELERLHEDDGECGWTGCRKCYPEGEV